jgi:hypothetical protein
MAEALVARGLSVTQLEQLPEVLPTVDPELGALVRAERGGTCPAGERRQVPDGFLPLSGVAVRTGVGPPAWRGPPKPQPVRPSA